MALGLAAGGWCLLGAFDRGDSTGGLVVRDSQGRVRIETRETGDAFSLVLLDVDGRAKLQLGMDRAGQPVVSLLDNKGAARAVLGQTGEDIWSVGVHSAAQTVASLSTEDEVGGGLVVHRSGATLAQVMASEATGTTRLRVASDAGAKADEVHAWATRTGACGVVIGKEQPEQQKVGLVTDRDSSLLWAGDSPLSGSPTTAGVRLAHVRSRGAMISIRSGEASKSPVNLADTFGGGGGLRIGGPGAKPTISAGISEDGKAQVLVVDNAGKDVLRAEGK